MLKHSAYALIFFLSCLITYGVNSAFAQTVKLSSGINIEQYFAVTIKRKKINCAGPIAGKYIAGRFVNKSGEVFFIPIREDLKNLKRKQKASKNPKSKNKLQTKIDRLTKRLKPENKTCRSNAASDNNIIPIIFTPSPESTQIPNFWLTPQATPTPIMFSSNCDSSGNTTKFGIPRGYIGNFYIGNSIWNTTCTGCHFTPWHGRTYQNTRSALTSIPQMIPLNISIQATADLTAFFNCP